MTCSLFCYLGSSTDFAYGPCSTIALPVIAAFLSYFSTMTCNTDIGILSVCPSICPSRSITTLQNPYVSNVTGQTCAGEARTAGVELTGIGADLAFCSPVSGEEDELG